MTMIARVTDGLPLAEGLDDGRDLVDAEMYKQQVKALFKNLSKGHVEASRMSVETGPYVFHYIIEGRVCYLTMCDRSYPKKLAFHYLEDLKNEFERVNGAHIETAARPYAFIKFDTFIQKTKKLYQDTRTQRNITKLNDELYEVQQIMTRNVQEVLGVGEKLDQVSQMSSRLTSESRIYADKARDLNRQALIRKWAPVAIVLGVVFLLFWVKSKLCLLKKTVYVSRLMSELPVNVNGFQELARQALPSSTPEALRIKRIMEEEPVNVNEFRELARRALPKMFYDFYAGGAEDQHTLKENEEAFHRIIIRPRILRDVSAIDLSTTVLGYNISMPVMIAPTSMQKLANPEGEIATARAASACGTIMVLSTSSSCSLEEVASCCNAIRFFQLYVYKRRDISVKLVQRAENNGYKAIVVTVDSPRLGRREADIKNKLVVPPLKNLEGLLPNKFISDGGSGLEALASGTLDASFCWEDISWLKSITNLPVLIKGVLTHEDAIKALEVGVAGIIVSNHGGRQLDYSPATISVLEEVVLAVGGKVPVLVDGGIRRGTDIFKAVALGARAVLVGRPVVFGLAAKGEYGVKRVLEMLKDELELTMALAGCSSMKEITRSHVRTKHEQKQHLVSML
ncbi:hypothetical protein V6N11_032332 [Hibiscus sabdariffa]|uniref:(S)-2-hydroxy-acid oxidase n=1 Tax=Hibiscus sabdariffa TaxID=183260 RepID=A0ABR2T0I4_9ROSI